MKKPHFDLNKKKEITEQQRVLIHTPTYSYIEFYEYIYVHSVFCIVKLKLTTNNK